MNIMRYLHIKNKLMNILSHIDNLNKYIQNNKTYLIIKQALLSKYSNCMFFKRSISGKLPIERSRNKLIFNFHQFKTIYLNFNIFIIC